MDNQNQQLPTEPVNPSQSLAPQPPVSPILPSKSNKLLLIIAVLVLLIAVATGSYILGIKQTQPPPQPTATATPTKSQPSPTPDPTANWKTYIDKKSYISFKYPLNGKITGEGPYIIPQSDGATANNVGISIPNEVDFVVLFYDSPQKADIKTNDFLVINNITWYGTFIDEKILDTKKDYCQKVNNVGCTTYHIYKTIQNNHEVEVGFYNLADKKFSQQILSTFRFD